jgi:anthranilate synthase component II
MRLLILDNYDSFTYNLFQLLNKAGCNDITVIKNDKLRLKEVAGYDKIIFSPGPGLPSEVPIMSEILNSFQKSKSILGVCLGHQAIACFFGAKLRNLTQPRHGIASKLIITDAKEKLFQGLKSDIYVGRYHSWVIDEKTLPANLKVTSKSDDGCIMSVAHQQYDIKGVQFHPESFITKAGDKILCNWLNPNSVLENS